MDVETIVSNEVSVSSASSAPASAEVARTEVPLEAARRDAGRAGQGQQAAGRTEVGVVDVDQVLAGVEQAGDRVLADDPDARPDRQQRVERVQGMRRLIEPAGQSAEQDDAVLPRMISGGARDRARTGVTMPLRRSKSGSAAMHLPRSVEFWSRSRMTGTPSVS